MAAALPVFQTTVGALSSLAGVGATLYYGGKDASKSVGSYLGFASASTLAWSLVAFSIFAGNPLPTNVIGGDSYATIQKVPVGTDAFLTATVVSELQFVLFALSIIFGGVGFRFKPKYFALFAAFWTTVVYAPEAFWQLNPLGGWARSYGIIDYAGGLLVHVSAGVAALVLGLLVGKGKTAAPEVAGGVAGLAAMVAVLAGTFFLNAGRPALGAAIGSVGSYDKSAALALLNTQMATGAGVATYALYEIIVSKAGWFKGEASLAGAAKGALIGMVATSSGAGFILPMWTVLIAFVTVVFVVAAELVSAKIAAVLPGWSVFLVHGLGGAVGVACTGLFAQADLGAPANGSWMYNQGQLGKQCAGISYIILMTGVATAILYLVMAGIAKFILQTSVVAKEEEAAPAAVEGAKAVVSA